MGRQFARNHYPYLCHDCFVLHADRSEDGHGGWVRTKFKGTPEEFHAKHVKQLTVLSWFGFILSPLYILLGIVLGFDSTAQLAVKVVIGALWIGVGAINLAMRKKYFEQPAGPVSRQ